jgi:hypothetical protein
MPSGGHLCGYVGVPKNHPAYGVSYTHEIFEHIDVHGGLTYGDEGDGEFRPEGTYWFGFDCAHSGDLSPYWFGKYGISLRHEVYRDMAYVTTETERLAAGLSEMTTLKYRIKAFFRRVKTVFAKPA